MNEFQSCDTRIRIYTDALKTENDVGPVLVHQNTTKQFQFNSHCTFTRANILAILERTETPFSVDQTNIDICSDQLIVLSNLESKTLAETLAFKIGNLIYNKDTRFIWTPGHCDGKKNEDADIATRNVLNNPDSALLSKKHK